MRRLFRETAQVSKFGAAAVPLCSNTVQVVEVGKTMAQEHHITFGPFRLDVTQHRLWREDQVRALRPRSLAVLRYLVEHPGRLVTKAELRQHVWRGTHVSDTVLRVCVQEIRAALGDAAAAPQYLQTVGREGYRLLVEGDLDSPAPLTARLIVGRQHEADCLEEGFQLAAQGCRQLVFVSGEVGIGKTTVIDLFLSRLVVGSGVRSARGQCVEHYGEGEPYLPLLEAMGQLTRGPGGPEVLAALRRYAPMWLVQLAGLVSETELERLQRQLQGATQARMMRELAETLEVLAADTPLVLVLEGLHWSDRSTVEILAYLGQRREPARLLLLGTYRPVETVVRAHPLRGMVQELGGRGQCVELRLELLPAADVGAYVAGRLAGPVTTSLATFIHARTDGNALFMVNIVEHLVQRGLVVRREGQWRLRDGAEARVASLPEGLRHLLLRRIEELPAMARQVLEAASVMGQEFAVAAVATGLQSPLEDIEVVCEELVAQQCFIEDIGLALWPDGTRRGMYRFQHALYQQVLYEHLGTSRRARLHQRLGARLEAGYGAQAGEIASQLAVHFERGGEFQRAAHYMQQMGEHAAQRNAPHEAVAIFSKGLELLAALPESPERAQHELTLQLALGEMLITLKGRTAPEVKQAYTRAHVLCQQGGETPQRVRTLWGLIQFYGAQAQLHTASELSQQLFDLVSCQPNMTVRLEGHLAVGVVALHRGDLNMGRTYLEQSLRFCASLQSSMPTFHGGFVSGVPSLTWLAQALEVLGYADQAQQRSQEALSLARQAGHTLSLVYAELYAALRSQLRRDVAATQAHADVAVTLATAQEAALRVEQGRMLQGWALAMRGDAAAGVAHIQQGLTTLKGVGPELLRPYWLALLSEAYGQAGQPEIGLQVVDEALMLVAATEERWWEAELYRLQGELLLHTECGTRHAALTAEECFQQALAVARGQQARALELRAALSLSRLWQQQGKRTEANDPLAPVYNWFTEGFDMPDLQEAKAILDAC
jgi:DNA-binding winged helix-turn-helix (wHTH) protein/predicted ATPase